MSDTPEDKDKRKAAGKPSANRKPTEQPSERREATDTQRPTVVASSAGASGAPRSVGASAPRRR